MAVADDKLPQRRRNLRTGFTTGACATAAAKAATRALLTGAPVEEIAIRLPIGQVVTFRVASCELAGDRAECAVVKDAGDDPDCTHGAHIHAIVTRAAEPGVRLDGGPGVGRVTKPGLGLEVGGPAINPVPRRMILGAVTEAADELMPGLLEREGLNVVIWVPGGEEMARKTLNARLGIVGGISILGTTGIVKPYSTAAYRASIIQAIDVALANGCDHIVLTTGGRSEKYAQALLPDLPEVAFVQMGDFVGASVKYCAKRPVRRVTLCGMMGKFSKIATGVMQTHAAGSAVDMEFLAGVARDVGAVPEVIERVRAANTGRHVAEILIAAGERRVFDRICGLICAQVRRHAGGSFEVAAVLTDFEGAVLGRAELPGDDRNG